MYLYKKHNTIFIEICFLLATGEYLRNQPQPLFKRRDYRHSFGTIISDNHVRGNT